MKVRQTSSEGGISFFGLLTIVFITLKLIGTIDWSWWWVLSPLWIPVALGLFIILCQMTIAALCSINDKEKDEEDDEEI